MNTRLVAYRPATNSATSDTAYQLDLQEAPNISLNFQFSDIKEPETRKASYSQTFKLPFTDNNNEFFQNWFNVNLTTLVFSTRTKFSAVLYVGTVPQFEGIIQLKGVYQKAQYYDVVLMSNTADLFSVIGSQKLKDVFLEADGSYSDELNHTFNATNIENSWNGASTAFQNTSGVSLRDADAGVQKVMYPLTVTREKFFYGGNNSNEFLDMDNPSAYDYDIAQEKMVDITQFRPSIQLKILFKLIMARAGFSYTSSFIDGDYFGKLFMTTCSHIALPTTPTIGSGGDVTGSMVVGTTTQNWGDYDTDAGQVISCGNPPNFTVVPANTTTPISTDYSVPIDTNSMWNTTDNYFTKLDINMSSVNVQFKIEGTNLLGCVVTNPGGDSVFELEWKIYRYNTTSGEEGIDWDTEYFWSYAEYPISDGGQPGGTTGININIDIPLPVPIGETVVIVFKPKQWKKANDGLVSTLRFGTATSDLYAGLYNLVSIIWEGYGTNIYSKTVYIPGCIDETITQKAFLKDIIERFNLIVMSDPNDASNIIIEPYNDYLAAGSIKHWTDKLDLSKEVIVKDTTSLQKEKITLTDLEDVDLWNKSIKEEQPDYNVYGKLEITETNNDFATGEMKNNPIFSPFINERVFQGTDNQMPSLLFNVAVQYEYTYKKVEGGYDNILEPTKPKLFYYNGAATDIIFAGGMNATNIYLHRFSASGTALVALPFDTYPLCSPFEISTSSGIGNLTNTTKSLYWSQAPPLCGDLDCFNYNQTVVSLNSLYYEYWSTYLNSIYHIDARIMECYLNLNEVDIFNFKFNDEIFIKDNYWRILTISNYQVGSKVSTKVKLIKSSEVYNGTCPNCDYTLGSLDGNNTAGNNLYVWCPNDDPDCVPDLDPTNNQPGIYVSTICCDCVGGDSWTWWPSPSPGIFPCQAVTGSMPINIKTLFSVRSFFSGNTTKTLLSGKISGSNMPSIIGKNNNKYSQAILPYYRNDVIIKYNTTPKSIPQLGGENHRIVLSGHTDADTRGYAYAQGDSSEQALLIPTNTNMIIRVKGIATVIGGESTTYTLGTTEAFAYYTAFKSINNTITQLSTAGGQQEFSIREGANPTTCTLYITSSGNELQFGLDDSQTDTKRIWALTVDLDINNISNMDMPYGANWALYQNGKNIELQNQDYLIWN